MDEDHAHFSLLPISLGLLLPNLSAPDAPPEGGYVEAQPTAPAEGTYEEDWEVFDP